MRAVAGNVRTLRMQAGLTLADLAAAAGLGKSTLAQLESGKANPSVETLWALATALRVPFARIVEEERPAMRVVRAVDVPAMHSAEAPGWAGRMLSASHARGTFDLYSLELDAGTIRNADPHHAGVVEHLVVVVGPSARRPADRAGRARTGRPRHLRRRRAARLRGARDDPQRPADGLPVGGGTGGRPRA